jgi:hypothetical protein
MADTRQDMQGGTKGGKTGTAPEARHVYGPRPVGALIPALVRPAFRKRAPATAQVLADWGSIVGPALAALTAPRRLSAGTLTIACAGPVALELQHMAQELLSRINIQLGHDVVQRLRFVQDETAAAPPPPPPPPRAPQAAARAVADLPAGPLREALEALGSVVLGAAEKATWSWARRKKPAPPAVGHECFDTRTTVPRGRRHSAGAVVWDLLDLSRSRTLDYHI